MSDQELRLAVLTAGYIARGYEQEMAIAAARETAEMMEPTAALTIDELVAQKSTPAWVAGQVGAERCDHCGKNPATCRGAYEGNVVVQSACDECCAHGGEDGRCEPIPPPAAPAPAVEQRRWLADALGSPPDLTWEELLGQVVELETLAAIGRAAVAYTKKTNIDTWDTMVDRAKEYLAAAAKGDK